MEHLSEYLSFRYTHAPRTLYKDRFSLIAGHFSIVGQSKLMRRDGTDHCGMKSDKHFLQNEKR